MQPDRSFWRGRRVCVTGGTGFLGTHLVGQLRGLGAAVRVFALPPPLNHPLRRLPDVECAWGNLLDPAAVRRAVAGRDVIFHTAGTVAVWGPALHRMHAIHRDGTRHVLAACDPGARLVHTSSIVAVGASTDGEPLTEDSAFNLRDLAIDYVHAKYAAEAEALASGLDVVVTNPGYLVGPDDPEGSVMGRLCARVWKGRLPVAPPGGFNLVDVRDVAAGHLLAAERGRGGRRYVLGGMNLSLRQFLRLLADAAGLHPRALPQVPLWALRVVALLAEGRARLTGREPYPSFQHARLNSWYWYVRSDRARDELGYRPRPLTDTLADAYRWYAAAGRVPLRGLRRWWMRPAIANVSEPRTRQAA
jgi:dihydroflavonol-4-reductase